VKECAAPNQCPVPDGAKLERCVFVSDRFPFRDEENEGSLACDLVQGQERRILQEIHLDVNLPSVELTALHMKFNTFKNWDDIRAEKEQLATVEVPIKTGETVKIEKVKELKNIVWGSGIQNGITLNVYWTDTLTRGDAGYQNILDEHCKTRANHVRASFSPMGDEVMDSLKPYIAALDAGCKLKAKVK
jgi:hypothetical protein